MSGILLITATSADIKLINRLLLHLRDWEFGAGDCFRLVLQKDNIAALVKDPKDATTPPVKEFSGNEWAGLSIDDVEKTILAQGEGGNTDLFLVLDEKGVREQTLILANRAVNYDEDEFETLNEYNKTRIPWIKVYGMFCNLNIANMEFFEFVDEDEEEDDEDDGDDAQGDDGDESEKDDDDEQDEDDEGEEKQTSSGKGEEKPSNKWFTYQGIDLGEDHYEPFIRDAEKEIEKLRQEGLA